MAGSLILSNNLIPFSEYVTLPNSYYLFNDYPDFQRLNTHTDLECFDDDPPLAGYYDDEPYLFTPGPTRFYWSLAQPISYEVPVKVYSFYRCFLTSRFGYRYFPETIHNAAILLMSNDKMVIGYFKEGKLEAEKELNNRQQSINNKHIFLNDIRNFLKTWQDKLKEAKLIFVRCNLQQYKALFEGLKEEEKYRHIPFIVCPPSIDEIKRVYQRIFTVQYHEYTELMKDLNNQKKSNRAIPVASVTQKIERKNEKKKFPWLNSKSSSLIFEAVERNDGDRLSDLLFDFPEGDMIDYLNTPQTKLNEGTFLHYAVRNHKPLIVEVLLEFGVDPAVTDIQGLVPYEYCKNEKIQEVFVNFREENGHDNSYWNKSKIPTRSHLEEINGVKDVKRVEFDKRANRDKIRRQRREKLDKRRIKVDSYG